MGALAADADTVVIWSGTRQAWWRPDGWGYTRNVAEAGRWPREAAAERLRSCRPDTVMQPAPAPRVPAVDPHRLTLTAYPPGDGPYERFEVADATLRLSVGQRGGHAYERFEVVADATGKVVIAGPMPIDTAAVHAACRAFRARVDAAGAAP